VLLNKTDFIVLEHIIPPLSLAQVALNNAPQRLQQQLQGKQQQQIFS
jgi:hypothetical protein